MPITNNMSYVNVPYLLSFLILFSLFQTVRTDSHVAEATLKNVIGENSGTFPKSSVADEKIQENLRSNETEITRRKPRTAANGSMSYGLECLSCFGNVYTHSWSCYSGHSVKTKKCADAEQCYTEINPKYIKRGCILPGRVNRTFVCKCPLCNDKPSSDISHYEYRHLNEWEYDNARLRASLIGMDLMCKVCETKGTNAQSDKNCRSGKNADYMVCGRNQLCYTNIDDVTDFVSRGCIDRKKLNSMYFFCNAAKCNSVEFPDPKQKIMIRLHQVQLSDDNAVKSEKALKSLGLKTYTSDFSSILFIISTLIIYCI